MTPTRRAVLGVSTLAFTTAGCLEDADDGDADDERGTTNVADWQRIDGATLSSSFPVLLHEPGGEDSLAEVHWHRDWAHWHKMPLEIPVNGWRTVVVRPQNRDLERIPLGEDAPHSLDVGRSTETAADLVDVSVAGDLVDIYGNAAGTGELVFQIHSEDAVVWTSPALTIDVSSDVSDS